MEKISIGTKVVKGVDYFLINLLLLLFQNTTKGAPASSGMLEQTEQPVYFMQGQKITLQLDGLDS